MRPQTKEAYAQAGRSSGLDLAIGKRDQAMVGDGHAMGVAAEILQHIFRAAEGSSPTRVPWKSET